MAKIIRRGPCFAVILCGLVGGLLLTSGRRYMPVASGQSFPDWECVPASNPCTTCAQTNNVWQCIFTLDGWNWGGCFAPFPVGCFENTTTCGDRYDCDTPPNYTGGDGCGDVYDICAADDVKAHAQVL